MADEQRPTNLPETFYRTYDQETRDYWDAHLEDNALRQNPKTGWGAERSSMLEAAGDVLRELTGPTGFTQTGGQEKVYLNEKLNRLKREARTVGADYTARVMATSPDFGPAEGQEAQLEKIRADIARIKPKSEEADLAKMILDNIASGDPYGLLSVRIDQLHRLINEPRSTESERLIELRQAADPPRLPEIIHEPETPRITPGRAFRGLGSLIGPGSKLKAVKRLFTLAQQGYQLLPEELQLLGDVLDMEALKKPIDFGLGRSEYPPGFKGGLDYFRQMLGMGPEEGGITSLPMDEASRTARAEEQGFNLDTYHATRDDFTTFEKGDLGYHFGTKEHANNRLERTRETTLLHPDGDYTGENILPTKIRLTNPLELPDVGDWKDPKTIAASALRPSRATGYSGEWGKAHEEELTEIIDTVTDYFDDFKFADKKEFKESPEAAELMEQIRDMIIEDGYDGVQYYNVAEADFTEEGKLILEHSYIVFDPKNIRSRFAKFDPEESKSADIFKAAGGFVDKPLHGGWNDVF